LTAVGVCSRTINVAKKRETGVGRGRPRTAKARAEKYCLTAETIDEPFDRAMAFKVRGAWSAYRLAVEDGTSARDPLAIYEMARWHLHGQRMLRIAKDPVRAVRLLREAAPELNRAAYDLGVCYELGVGVTADGAIAYEWYTTAARLGSLLGREAIARCLANGIGVPRNEQSAADVIGTLAHWGAAMPRSSLPKGFLKPR
jgi:hypothetical protein